MRREETSPAVDAMLEKYQQLQAAYAELEKLYAASQKRIAELEVEARGKQKEPPPK